VCRAVQITALGPGVTDGGFQSNIRVCNKSNILCKIIVFSTIKAFGD